MRVIFQVFLEHAHMVFLTTELFLFRFTHLNMLLSHFTKYEIFVFLGGVPLKNDISTYLILKYIKIFAEQNKVLIANFLQIYNTSGKIVYPYFNV